MSRLKKVLIAVVGLGALLVLGLFLYVQLNWDKQWDVPLPDLEASTDPEVIARGKYLVRGPAHCSNCHVGSFEEFKRADGGEEIPLAGGVVFPMGPLGQLSPANLTSDTETGLGRYSDGQVFRMMRHAIKPDGTATIALMMPFWNMADEDLVAVVSYLRSLEPVRREVPAPEWTFMGKAMRVFLPPFQPILEPTPPDHAPPMTATPERGEYIARFVANCFACHTKHDEATMEQTGPSWAGGSEFEPMPMPGADPTQWTRSPNLTPHPSGVLKNFPTKEAWIQRFRAGRTVDTSPMHWGPFSRMSDEDLTALWLFFNTLDPIDNEVGAMVFAKAP
jgi:mono/diheme cytochrome c family protein